MKNSRKWLLAGAVLVFPLAAVMSTARSMLGGGDPVAEVETAQLRTGRIDRVERLTGRVVDLNSRKLSFAVTGIVSRIHVEEGERVPPGALLARMEEEPEYAEKLEAARLDAESAAQRMRETGEEAAQWKALVEAGVESRQALKKKEQAYEEEKQKHKRSQAALRGLKDKASQYVLRADADAQVMAIDLVRGQRAASSQGITLGDPRSLIIEAKIDEATAAQLKVGQELTYELAIADEKKSAARPALRASRRCSTGSRRQERRAIAPNRSESGRR